MTTATIHFIFKLKGGGTMETTAVGTSAISEISAISDAWLNLAKSDFDRILIAQVRSITVLSTEVK